MNRIKRKNFTVVIWEGRKREKKEEEWKRLIKKVIQILRGEEIKEAEIKGDTGHRD